MAYIELVSYFYQLMRAIRNKTILFQSSKLNDFDDKIQQREKYSLVVVRVVVVVAVVIVVVTVVVVVVVVTLVVLMMITIYRRKN